MFQIIDIEHRRFVEEDFETREAAEQRLAELIARDSTAEGVLRVSSTGERPEA